ncbi:MAG: TetR/AcrR family transcriptional regulator [Candidatus Delongbacteria bacterium]|jgi:TetR/AcrR family transcriptional regulator|nr:TetR/AcrR family transcriptional regulator [Candidatus Delongbacteria bacterium]
MKKDISTEEKIIKAAGQAFKSKGYAGARMQEIADSAGINKAMLHYYFRSKKLLFDKIFIKLMNSFLANIIATLNSDNTWDEILTDLSEKLFAFISQNRDIPLFLVNELHKNPDFFTEQLLKFKKISNSSFFSKIDEEGKKGNIIIADPLQILVHVISGMMYPAIAEPIISSIGSFREKDFDNFLSQRKDIVPKIIIEYLKKV